MWEDNGLTCENNCQCSGLITENFKINSGNSGTKRKQEAAYNTNYKLKMNPHTLDFKSPLSSPIQTPSKRKVLGEIQNSPYRPETTFFLKSSPLNEPFRPKISPVIERLKNSEIRSPLIDRNTMSPLTSKSKKSTNKISRIFEERTRFKENKENEEFISDTFVKLDMEEDARDCSFGFGNSEANWSMAKLDFTDALSHEPSYVSKPLDLYVPEKDIDHLDPDMETLHDLEEEFASDNFDQCTKYEIISTDSPDIISRGRTVSRKVTASNLVFGAPLADSEPSTSFNRPNATATRMLNFEESFEFTSPAAKKNSFSVKKSLKFNDSPKRSYQTPTKYPLQHEKSGSSIGSMTSSPGCSQLRLFTSESMTSMESGFISELEEPFLDIDEASNSPKLASFKELLSGPIKENILTNKDYMKRLPLQRSLSFNPEPKPLFLMDSSQKKKRMEVEDEENVAVKKRKSSNECIVVQRPVLQRAFSENHASIMTALARSASEPDLIGDFSRAHSLPACVGQHAGLRALSCHSLAQLIRGQHQDAVSKYQIIDCRYPYEYEGGHIPGALNLYTPELVKTFLEQQGSCEETQSTVLVFHCEFSLERGPKLCRYLRSTDRSKNMENYPQLNYPEIYILHQGYRTFYQNYPELCLPEGYTAMLDPKHTHLLKKHRSVDQPTSFYTHHKTKSNNRLNL